MLKVLSRIFVVLLLLNGWFPEVLGQPILPSDLKKPKKFENKLLGSEKFAEKKFTAPRRFIQNNVTHYNWYFNANNKLNEVITRAKAGHKDDFAQLLSFYNYSLDKTALDKNELDSVVYKANSGILVHDLRNAWIDNLFMLMGRAYYYKKELDSAYLTFQYINYAFSPKEKDGYDMPIGSNANEGTNALSVSTKETNNLAKRAMTTPPSRNEAFIWQIRTYLEKDALPEASSLIETLKNDRVFPERLHTDLIEVQALLFYKRKIYDSAAVYLEKALGNANDRVETSRWEYLIAQLYERARQPELAKEFYDRAIKHTLDPILEVYARLNSIKQNNKDSIAIQKNMEELLKMGRRDRYTKYRDIIYYMAAQIELERNNTAAAKSLLLKSAVAATENLNSAQRTRSFLLLGDLSFKEKLFPESKRFYDSVNTTDPGVSDPLALEKRKDILSQIVIQTEIISRQDSLQRLAGMPEAERDALLKKIVKQYRKKQGFKEEEGGNAAVGLNAVNAPAPDLFESSSKGDWYFNNPSLKSKGFNAFKSTWGNRPNVDNWRRQAAVAQTNAALKQAQANTAVAGAEGEAAPGEISYESLLKNIPLEAAQMEQSKDSVENAMLDLAIVYINGLEEYPAAADTLEKFQNDYAYSSRMPEALYYLYLCYRQTGNEAKAAEVQAELKNKYAGTRYDQQINNALTGSDDKAKAEMTRLYENIYTLFIEGNFEQAIALKKETDSAYGTIYWTPHLLYIESVYYLKQRQDTEAKNVLQRIIELYPDSPLAARSKTILEVLGRRKEIEEYLTNLQLDSIAEEPPIQPDNPLIAARKPQTQDSLTVKPPEQDIAAIRHPVPAVAPPKKDTIAVTMPPPVIPSAAPTVTQPAVTPPPVAVTPAPPKPVKNDTLAAAPPAQPQPLQPQPASAFSYTPDKPHLVVIVLNKVDPVYVTESRNAFNRYNKERYSTKTIDIRHETLNDSLKLVIMSGFENSAAALEYAQKTQPIAATQIVPWLPAGKYTFLLISEQNIEVLKVNQDMQAYRNFLDRNYPVKLK